MYIVKLTIGIEPKAFLLDLCAHPLKHPLDSRIDSFFFFFFVSHFKFHHCTRKYGYNNVTCIKYITLIRDLTFMIILHAESYASYSRKVKTDRKLNRICIFCYIIDSENICIFLKCKRKKRNKMFSEKMNSYVFCNG